MTKYSSPLPTSARASSTACFTANKHEQAMHCAGSPEADET